ncbi:tetraspanin-6-like [Iris pallida]|uniref:Tetraspanin-6-like n=1 Tax=Iris pallida TaxID=29817 RepID=A0AAX6IGL5_IRIPA|nr:tetraspanin-6-like [Iris pallida]KAJ6852083.1 tetraspanin-6-like [Iris pallida]
MYRFSNTLVGYLNLLTLLASIPIIGGALWLARNSATCESSLQTPLLVLGFIVLLVSLAGFVGACFHIVWALWLYLFVMLLLIAALLGLTVFGFVVTGGGGGTQVPGRVYMEYKLDDYSGWLKKRIAEDRYWRAAKACVVGSKACSQLAAWTPLDYLQRDLTPIQSGCCKPPTACTYGNGMPMATTVGAQDEDCYRWNNDVSVLCYNCDSCKAGVLEQVRRDWHKLSVLNVVVVIFLIALYSIGCCAFRNARRYESDHPYGQNHMSKIHPRWDYYWQVEVVA